MSVLAVAPSASAFVTTAPLSPQNVTWQATDDGVEVTWDAPLYDGGDPVLYYRVYRDGQLIADEVQDEVYLDVDVLPSSTESASAVTSTYAVTAVNSVGESDEGGLQGQCYVFPTDVDPDACSGVVIGLAMWLLDQII